jgi:hypothetical protein
MATPKSFVLITAPRTRADGAFGIQHQLYRGRRKGGACGDSMAPAGCRQAGMSAGRNQHVSAFNLGANLGTNEISNQSYLL